MRSLLVVHAVDEPGGAELALLRAAPLLLERGWRITMTTPSGRRPSTAPRAVAWRAQAVGGGRAGGAGTLLASGAFRALAADHDVVHLNGAATARLLPALASTGVVARAAARGARIRRHGAALPPGPLAVRSVLHLHDVPSRVPAGWRAADALLADSAACARPVAAALGREVVTTGRPVDLVPAPGDPPWPPDGRPVVAFVGRIEPEKAPLDLVAAAERVWTAEPNARIILVGDDRRAVDPRYAGLVDRRAAVAGVERWGWQADVPGLLRHVDVLVVPSEREPFSTVAAEALAVGVPVVATAVGGLVEIVRDGVTGRLVPPRDPVALAHGIVWALRNGPLLGDACRAAARAWSATAFADRLHATYVGTPPAPRVTREEAGETARQAATGEDVA